MAKYRNHLPQLDGGLFLSDGGMETTLIFKQGIELPLFASFPLVRDARGRAALTDYYESHLAIARKKRVGFVLDTATWRANPDWAAQLGYDLPALKEANLTAVDMIVMLRNRWEAKGAPIVLNGAIGPRGDGYKAGRMEAAEAEDYHSWQVGVLAGSQLDMVSAITMNTVNEALGIAKAAQAHDMPVVVSFTVETDGRLVTGATLREAVETVDAATGGYPAYYMINCAHPTHFERELKAGEAWLKRVRGIRANASRMSHAELDESPVLDEGDMHDLGRRYRDISGRFPAIRVLGGCCGTDHRHIEAICEAVAPAQAA